MATMATMASFGTEGGILPGPDSNIIGIIIESRTKTPKQNQDTKLSSIVEMELQKIVNMF